MFFGSKQQQEVRISYVPSCAKQSLWIQRDCLAVIILFRVIIGEHLCGTSVPSKAHWFHIGAHL